MPGTQEADPNIYTHSVTIADDNLFGASLDTTPNLGRALLARNNSQNNDKSFIKSVIKFLSEKVYTKKNLMDGAFLAGPITGYVLVWTGYAKAIVAFPITNAAVQLLYPPLQALALAPLARKAEQLTNKIHTRAKQGICNAPLSVITDYVITHSPGYAHSAGCGNIVYFDAANGAVTLRKKILSNSQSNKIARGDFGIPLVALFSPFWLHPGLNTFAACMTTVDLGLNAYLLATHQQEEDVTIIPNIKFIALWVSASLAFTRLTYLQYDNIKNFFQRCLSDKSNDHQNLLGHESKHSIQQEAHHESKQHAIPHEAEHQSETHHNAESKEAHRHEHSPIENFLEQDTILSYNVNMILQMVDMIPNPIFLTMGIVGNAPAALRIGYDASRSTLSWFAKKLHCGKEKLTVESESEETQRPMIAQQLSASMSRNGPLQQPRVALADKPDANVDIENQPLPGNRL